MLTVIHAKIEKMPNEMLGLDKLPCFLVSLLRSNPSDLTLSILTTYMALL